MATTALQGYKVTRNTGRLPAHHPLSVMTPPSPYQGQKVPVKDCWGEGPGQVTGEEVGDFNASRPLSSALTEGLHTGDLPPHFHVPPGPTPCLPYSEWLLKVLCHLLA